MWYSKVRWLGSHAAMTCHIAVMRHVTTGVASIGHFDNFCCWQFGEESSAHRDGIAIMLDEIRKGTWLIMLFLLLLRFCRFCFVSC